MTAPVLALLPRKVYFVGFGVILAVGALFWAHHAGYESGKLAEWLATDVARVDTAKLKRAAAAAAVDSAVKAAKPVVIHTAALHDSVQVHDTVTVTITLPSPSSTPVSVEIPAIVVRRIVQDSVDLMAKDRIIAAQVAQLVADSATINAQDGEIQTLRSIRAPACGAKCKATVAVVKVAIVAESVVRLARWLKPH